jgi:hypothetical protein
LGRSGAFFSRVGNISCQRSFKRVLCYCLARSQTCRRRSRRLYQYKSGC